MNNNVCNRLLTSEHINEGDPVQPLPLLLIEVTRSCSY